LYLLDRPAKTNTSTGSVTVLRLRSVYHFRVSVTRKINFTVAELVEA